MCCTALIRSVLETSDICAFNGGSNVEIQPLGIDLVTFEVAGHNSEFSKIFVDPSSKLIKSAPIAWISKFEPPLDAPLFWHFQAHFGSACETLFLKMGAKCVHKLWKYRFFSPGQNTEIRLPVRSSPGGHKRDSTFPRELASYRLSSMKNENPLNRGHKIESRRVNEKI